MLQCHDGSPNRPHVLVIAPTGTVSINKNGLPFYLALGISCYEKFNPLDSKNITSLHNKFLDIHLNINEILLVCIASIVFIRALLMSLMYLILILLEKMYKMLATYIN